MILTGGISVIGETVLSFALPYYDLISMIIGMSLVIKEYWKTRNNSIINKKSRVKPLGMEQCQ